jgi:anionic cell wall polymer biosynthesis LytR-Cps2A-Psr (LCP) family protein
MGDIGRIERQQKFIQALSKQVFSLAVLPKIPSLITEISQNLNTDMNLAQMIKLAREVLSLGQMEINSHTIPGEGDSVHYGGSYWIMDEQKTRELTASIFSPEDQSEAGSQDGTAARRSSGSATSLGTAGTR